jgi:NADPH2:quinone reductase
MSERPEPPGNGEDVLIDVRAAGVAFPDLLISRGRYQVRPDLPYVAGQEIAGVVRAAPAASGLVVGERVWAAVSQGGFAEVAATPADTVFPLDHRLSFEQGAALPANFLTAVFALQRRGALHASETVLVLGAAGGLGTACVAVAKAVGARVIAVVSEGGKVATAQAAGADDVVVGAEWRPQVLEKTGGRGVDLVADVTGGPQTLEAVRSTAPEGRVLVLGFTSGDIPAIATNRLLLRNVSLVGVGLGALVPFQPGVIKQTGEEVTRLVAAGVRPVVGQTFPLEEGPRALRQIEGRQAKGKLVLTV